MPSPFPSTDEQRAIADFLDHHGQAVRRFIRNRRRLIEVLSEQKQAIIDNAITRGLDPNVRLKPSGIDWLGDVPEHWEVSKLKSLFRRRGSGTTPAGDSYYDGEIPWVMTGDLNDGMLTGTQHTVTQKALEEVRALRLYPPGSLLVAMYGATIGKTGVLGMKACTNQACCVLADPIDDADVRFLQLFVIAARIQLVQQSYGGGQPNINSEIVQSLRVPLPPRIEQDWILDSIETQSKGLNLAIANANREIDLIDEFRACLIADVVTGKIDVRHLAPDAVEATTADPESWEEGDEVIDGQDAGDLDTVEEMANADD
jgi:type I restriction enzyme S subunit